jgi:molybdate transport system ATP-binding protein
MIAVDIEQRLGSFSLEVKFNADAPVVGLFGRSGSGKTSVINAIAGINTPDRGRIRVNGTDLFDSATGLNVPMEARRVGYVFQDALLFPHLSVADNLRYGQRCRPTAEIFVDAGRAIDVLGLQPLLERKPRHLSGGEKQRVAIGRALLAQPRVLLMDEPLAALDVERKGEILDYIERLRDEFHVPIVYVSHTLSEITRLADTAVVLAEGRVLAAGDVESVMGRPDLRQAIDRYEAGALIETRVAKHDTAAQLTTLAFDGGELLVPLLDAAIDVRMRARIQARDVSLALNRPEGISILNVLPGTVAFIAEPVGAAVDVHVAVGRQTIAARITRFSAEQLGLRAGLPVHALIKAVSFEPPGSP